MQKKKGISLIVLVITIIVMIVLAGAIILSLNNAGIIERANQAVKDTDEATVKELAQMAWAEAYANKIRDVDGLRAKVEKTLMDNGINEEGNIQYFINVTDKGVTVKPIEEAWVLNQKELKVKRGTEELTIGQSVNYDETNGGKVAVEKDVQWKVLGADDDGNLLIMSDEDVAQVKLGGSDIDVAHESWKTGAGDITKACQKAIPIAGTNNAISVRSIEVEDVDKITGYDKTTYGRSTVPYQYGNTVTYTYDGTTYPTYTGTNGVTKKLTTDHKEKGFYWSDGKYLYHVEEAALLSADNATKEDKTITVSASKAIITSTYYGYLGAEEANGLETKDDAYKMLFRNGDDTTNVTYWLASPYVNAGSGGILFGMCRVNNGKITGADLFNSYGGTNTPTRGVRAVVTLSSDTLASDLT